MYVLENRKYWKINDLSLHLKGLMKRKVNPKNMEWITKYKSKNKYNRKQLYNKKFAIRLINQWLVVRLIKKKKDKKHKFLIPGI